ncbi:MAG: hypothetical protein DRJ37_06950 [Thermoprotei archaeon]|nr:MAG: hypothetical protein DRJ37_06950 [Thermoprotei archaeon]
MLRVLMITREYPPFVVGGVATHTYYLTKYLRKMGIYVKVVSFGDPKLSTEDTVFIEPRSSIISKETTSIAGDIRVPLDIVRYTNFVKNVLKEEQFDTVHVQEPYVAGFISFEHKVTTIHDTSYGEIKGYMKYLDSSSLKRIAFYIAMGYTLEFASILTSKIIINPSIDVAWEMIKVYRVPKEKIRVIPNGVEEPPSNEPSRDAAREILGIPNDHFIVFTTAQHVGRKRIDTLIRAAKILKNKGVKGFKIIIGGKGPLTPHLKNFATKLQVNDIVEFTSWVPKEKLPLYYRATDVFVITSEYEAGPITMLEAGIRSIPIIISDIPSGFAMIAKNGVDCLKFKLGDPNDLAEKMIMLMNDRRLWKKLALGAKIFASAFTWERIARSTMKIYRDSRLIE